jgi:polyisoprenoid-binding protein YceI
MRWNIDPSHSSIQFSVRHLVISKVRGTFARWTGSLELDPAALTSARVSVEIDAASIDTREPKRDDHLRSADFFDVGNHPTVKFESREVRALGGDRFAVIGPITLRGITRDVELEVEYLGTGKDPWGNARVAFTAKAAINRKDFGLNWNQALEAGGVLVGEQVELSFDVQAVQVAAQTQAA